jgi:hypothetical protein
MDGSFAVDQASGSVDDRQDRDHRAVVTDRMDRSGTNDRVVATTEVC